MLKAGKLPEEVLVRSVLGQIGHRREEVLSGPAVGADCAVLKTDPDEVLLFSTDPITGASHGIGGHSIHITANDLSAAGAEPVAVLLTVLVPESTDEAEIGEMMRSAEEACASLGMEILGGHTEITDAVTKPVISVTGIGKCKKERMLKPENVRGGMDVLVTKWIGLEATAILAADREADLAGKISPEVLERAKGFSAYLSVVPEAGIALENGVVLMHDITEGGILGALWEAAEVGGAGLRIDREKIPVREETREICGLFGADPLRIMSSGSMLMIAEDGEKLVGELKKAGIPASVIGKTVDTGERVLTEEGRETALAAPEPDELYAALRKQI